MAPFINQIATLPLVSCHNMSLFPSALKSPVPATAQLVPTMPTRGVDETVGAVHKPDRHVATGIAPQYVALSVAVEVARAGHGPTRADRADKSSRQDRGAVHKPDRHVAAGSRHKMSLFPSPLKSPVADNGPAHAHLPTRGVDETWVPFMSQIATLPLVSRHNMSPKPSPLKSPVPAMAQLGPIADDRARQGSGCRS